MLPGKGSVSLSQGIVGTDLGMQFPCQLTGGLDRQPAKEKLQAGPPTPQGVGFQGVSGQLPGWTRAGSARNPAKKSSKSLFSQTLEQRGLRSMVAVPQAMLAGWNPPL